MKQPSARRTASFSAVLTALVVLAGLAWPGDVASRLWAQPPAPEPQAGDHSGCAGGICPLGPAGRSCSCGCALRADEQVVQPRRADGAAECIDERAGAYPCHEVDLLASLPLAEIGGGRGNDIWGWTDPATGREYAIVGRTSGTSFVDVTDPRQPIYLGNLPTHTVDSTWRDIRCSPTTPLS